MGSTASSSTPEEGAPTEAEAVTASPAPAAPTVVPSMHLAAAEGQVEELRTALCAGDNDPHAHEESTAKWDGNTPVTLAVVRGHCECAKMLLDAGADVHCCHDGTPLLVLAAQRGFTSIVELLLARGASVNARDPDDNGPALSWAAAGGHTATVQLLLDAGADVAAVDNDGDGPLTNAVLNNAVEAAKLLVGAGAPVDAPNKAGKSALAVAKEREDEAMTAILSSEGGGSSDGGTGAGGGAGAGAGASESDATT